MNRGVICCLVALLIPSRLRGQTAADVQRIDSIVSAQVDSGFSGVVLVAQKDSVLLRRAYAPPSERLTAGAAFWIASITKSFTAAAVLQLQEKGRLSVNDSIGRFLNGVPADKRAITIRQLLTHTSGLGGDYSGAGIVDRSRAINAILAPSLSSKPGTSYKYGDDDYELLAAIIEVVSGRSWEDFVFDRIVRPAGLREAGFACRIKNARRPVERSARAATQGTPISRAMCDWAHKGANGMSATADDLLKWTRAFSNDSALNRPLIFVRREAPFDVSYGYGVRVYTHDHDVVEIMHSGSGDNDHNSIARVLRSGLTIIVLSNAGHHAGTTWSSYVAQRLARRE
ncbi:MAG TPA: serine hydrolase domain-containing protein [Gemmatimonadaceae bacterium]